MTSLSKIKYNSLFCLLLVVSCNDIQTTVSNNPNLNLDYKLNFRSLNNGENKDSVIVNWEKYYLDDFDKYQLSFDNSQIDITDSSINSYIISLNAGKFSFVNLSLYNNQNSIINQESIQIHTSSVEPVNDLIFDRPSFSSIALSWTPSIEPDFEKYIIYRSSSFLEILPFLDNPQTECNDINNCIEIATIYDKGLNNYDDSLGSQSGTGHSVMITTFDTYGNFKNSTVYTEFNTTFQPGISNFTVSSNFEDKINISWDNLNTDEFYAIEIWRSSKEDDLDPNFYGEMTNDNCTKIITIYDSDLDFYEDRNDVGSSTSWFYILKYINKYSIWNYTDEILEGMVKP